ncbi:hypothetical protein AAHB37_11190 [Glutamicibacter halophytocola]|uniref:hypothetical protein n=1 Tax=Glutamicibacter halophytocola TaxID=1933880 RepID=UPI00321BC9D5
MDYTGIDRVEVAVSSADDQTILVLLSEAKQGAAAKVAKQFPEGVNVASFSQHGGSAADGKGSLQVLAGNPWLGEKVLGGEVPHYRRRFLAGAPFSGQLAQRTRSRLDRAGAR